MTLSSNMGQYDKTYKLVVEEKTNEEKKVHKLDIEAGKVFDTEGALHINVLRDLYDAAIGRKEKDDEEKEKEGKKKSKKK